MATLLAADIGGTKSEVAIFQEKAGDLHCLCRKRYRNALFPGVEEILAEFFAEFSCRPLVACIAVAGVVTGDRVRLTNLPWLLDSLTLETRFSLKRVQLINDLTAVAASLAHLGVDDLAEIQPGVRAAGEICGIIAPGTGLGQGMVLEVGGRVFARGSEGGHCNFAPVDDEQMALLAWMRQKQDPVSYESLIAGPGLANLYHFCSSYHGIRETPDVAQAMAQAGDPIPAIIDGALRQESCPLCLQTMELFLSILGSETNNLALKLYSRGGMYLGGGILPRLFGKVSFAGFLKSFHAKGLMTEFMQTIPVQLILRPDAAVLGAGYYGRSEFAEFLRHDSSS